MVFLFIMDENDHSSPPPPIYIVCSNYFSNSIYRPNLNDYMPEVCLKPLLTKPLLGRMNESYVLFLRELLIHWREKILSVKTDHISEIDFQCIKVGIIYYIIIVYSRVLNLVSIVLIYQYQKLG